MHSYSTDQPRRWRVYFGLGAVALGLTFLSDKLAQFFEVNYGVTIGALSFGVASIIVYTVFTKWLWDWHPVRWIGLTKVPNLNGTWEGHLHTSYDGAEGSESAAQDYDELTPMEATITIAQTWDKILISLDGPESGSESVGATLLVNGRWPTLTYNYENSGKDHHNGLNHHYGTTMLEYNPEDETLDGMYYTGPNRENTGRLEFNRE
jgi:hypothetical protein